MNKKNPFNFTNQKLNWKKCKKYKEKRKIKLKKKLYKIVYYEK